MNVTQQPLKVEEKCATYLKYLEVLKTFIKRQLDFVYKPSSFAS